MVWRFTVRYLESLANLQCEQYLANGRIQPSFEKNLLPHLGQQKFATESIAPKTRAIQITAANKAGSAVSNNQSDIVFTTNTRGAEAKAAIRRVRRFR